jgi:hypothetical protein
MRRAIVILITLVVLVGTPVALASGATDTLDEQVNAQTAAADEAMTDDVEDIVDEAEEEPPVFDPGEFMEPGDEAMLSGEQDLVTYDVDGDEISNPQVTPGLDGELQELASDEVAQRDVWDLFARVSQQPYEDIIDSFVAFTDGPENILAAVAADPANGFETWTVFIDVADLEDRAELLLTVAHEYAHIVTLATDQIDYIGTAADPGSGGCGGQVELVGEGCAQAGSYYEAYNEFWAPLEAEHAELDQIADEDEFYAAVEQFYADHQEEFVTPYSATSQAEDMAESYSYWVIADDPSFGGIAQEKIEFWEQFPELVAGREAARDALGL